MVVLFSKGGARRVERGSASRSVTPVGVEGGKPDRSLSRVERLQDPSEFHRVYDSGKSYRGSLIVLFVLSLPDLERRAGFVASRRVGNSVSRNRAKRLLREAYRHHKHTIPERGFHVVLVARNTCRDAGFIEVEQDLLRLLRVAGFARGDLETPATLETDCS